MFVPCPNKALVFYVIARQCDGSYAVSPEPRYWNEFLKEVLGVQLCMLLDGLYPIDKQTEVFIIQDVGSDKYADHLLVGSMSMYYVKSRYDRQRNELSIVLLGKIPDLFGER